MLLSADQILQAVEAQEIRLSPFDPNLLKPASYVLRLGDSFRRWTAQDRPVELWKEDASRGHLSEPEDFTALTLRPGEFFLVSTQESLSLSLGISGTISTLSHVARFGLLTHFDASLVSPGFGLSKPTSLTLEICSLNPSPLVLAAGMPICHITFTRTEPVDRAANALFRSIYEGRSVPHEPMLHEEFSLLLTLAKNQ